MTLEDQVTSFELSKRLKELGVKQDSYFYWCLDKDGLNGGLPLFYRLQDIRRLNQSFYYPKDRIAAFTVAELLEILPLINGNPLQLLKGYSILEYSPTYFSKYDQILMSYETIETLKDENSANCLAKMLLYLIENGLYEND